MDFDAGARTAELRAQAREFLREHLTPQVRAEVHEREDRHHPEFYAAVAAQGWIAPFWPEQDGGVPGWTRADYDVIYEELASAGAPVEAVAVTTIIAETIRRVGTAEQKRRILGPVRRGEMVLALGYTEPEAGSDLASARIRVERDGDEWVINGQKNFTTHAHLGQYVFLLGRTDPQATKHKGLTMFLVPTSTPGYSFTRVYTVGDERTNISYYDNVRIGDEWRVGEEGQGWEIVSLALAFERGGELASHLRRLRHAAVATANERPDLAGPRYLRRLGRLCANTEVSRLLGTLASWSRDKPGAGAVEGAMAKVFPTEAFIHDSGALLEAVGPDGLLAPGAPGALADGRLNLLYRESQISTLYGGSTEVLSDLIARARLGLPRAKK